jgi:hypothetical protein
VQVWGRSRVSSPNLDQSSSFPRNMGIGTSVDAEGTGPAIGLRW